MELIILLAVLFAVFVYVMIRGSLDEKRQRLKEREYLRQAYGSFADQQYSQDELDRIARFYLRHNNGNDGNDGNDNDSNCNDGNCNDGNDNDGNCNDGNGNDGNCNDGNGNDSNCNDGNCIDGITWNDLNMDSVFASMNFTQSSSGEEYLYAMLRQPRLSDKEGQLADMERHICYMMANEKERLDTLMLLKKLGKTGKYSLFDYMDYLEQLGVRGNLKHYACIALLAAAIGLLFVNASLGVTLLIAAACVNIVLYMKEKGVAAPYVTTFAYILRMVRCADAIIRQDYSAEMGDYITLLKDKRGRFRSFESGSGMVLKMNMSGGSLEEILFDYIKMLTHIDLIKFNQMLGVVRRNKQEIFAIAEAVGYLDAVISIAYFRAALPRYCVPRLEEGAGAQFAIMQGYHPSIRNPVANSFAQSRGMLVTGSNASGKSTFLKMAAINAILAQTVHTCAAQGYRGNYYRIYSSMALRDNLDSGESYYIVEIKALKRIMDAASVQTGRPLLCFVDEVLRGANTVERIAASAQILEQISRKGVLCFAATHDIELTHLLENSYDNFHFEEDIKEGDVLFSYHLLKGRARTRNAIKLLGVIGFSEDIIKRADDMAAQFLESGEWKKLSISKGIKDMP